MLSAEVIWPLFHYIPLSMLESDTDMIHQRWEDYTHLNKVSRTLTLTLTFVGNPEPNPDPDPDPDPTLNKAFAAAISKMWKKVRLRLRLGLGLRLRLRLSLRLRLRLRCPPASASLHVSPLDLACISQGDIILVHDYHLMLLPALLRDAHPKALGLGLGLGLGSCPPCCATPTPRR